MVNFFNWCKAHLPTQRRLIQLYAALLYNAHAKGFIKGNIYTGSSKMLCVPGLNCYSCPGAVGACPLGALQNAVASSSSRAPTYILGILLLYGLLLGRTICGYLCPFGLLQELLHKLPTPKIRKSRITRILSWLKYVILSIFVFLVPFWYSLQSYPVPAFCKYICPAGTLEGAIGLLSNPVNADKYAMLGRLFTYKFVILIAIIAACVFAYRAFCRFLCPLGAIYGLFSKVALIGVNVDASNCIDCGRCVSHCKMDIRQVSDHECIHCGECINVCPTNAISFKAGKFTIHGPEIQQKTEIKKQTLNYTRFIAWGIALVILVAAFVFFNTSNTPDNTELLPNAPETSIATGSAVGMLAPDFSAPIYGSESPFVLSKYRGKTVVINFWATWCTPCCSELPYFDEIYSKYGDEVIVIALHSNLVTDDVVAYLGKFNYQMPFALDVTGDIIKSYGGSTMLPHTVIIDENGVITYNAVGSLTLDKLKSLLDIQTSYTITPTLNPTTVLKR